MNQKELHLIDKSALVAEIKKRIKGLKDCHADTVAGYAGEISGLERLLSFIDTLEAKEDLETFDKRVTKMWGRCAANPNDTIACLHIDSFIEIARHFYELGLKAQKGEKV